MEKLPSKEVAEDLGGGVPPPTLLCILSADVANPWSNDSRQITEVQSSFGMLKKPVVFIQNQGCFKPTLPPPPRKNSVNAWHLRFSFKHHRLLRMPGYQVLNPYPLAP